MTGKRQPSKEDLIELVLSLANSGVEYIVIGGAAMALHGFPRMTKDIDLLLPIDSENNKRLLKALEAVSDSLKGGEALGKLRPEWMNKGFSTSLEADISVDLLYVAADCSFEDLRGHIKIVIFNGVPITTLDVDGMLLSKKTTREDDIPDRIKLGRLKNAQIEFEKNKRISNLPKLENLSSLSNIFGLSPQNIKN
jgi:hypothetical protein